MRKCEIRTLVFYLLLDGLAEEVRLVVFEKLVHEPGALLAEAVCHGHGGASTTASKRLAVRALGGELGPATRRLRRRARREGVPKRRALGACERAQGIKPFTERVSRGENTHVMS